MPAGLGQHLDGCVAQQVAAILIARQFPLLVVTLCILPERVTTDVVVGGAAANANKSR
uniref:hypothetical protein n=1 Tax=Kitasatospora griseola TaxID=2064 RepID=UPI001670969A